MTVCNATFNAADTKPHKHEIGNSLRPGSRASGLIIQWAEQDDGEMTYIADFGTIVAHNVVLVEA